MPASSGRSSDKPQRDPRYFVNVPQTDSATDAMMEEMPLRWISAVALACHGKMACMTASDDKYTVCVYKLPEYLVGGSRLTAEPQRTYVLKRPTYTVAGGQPMTMAIPNPFDAPDKFHFATLSKSCVKLWDYRSEDGGKLDSKAVIFGKNPQQNPVSMAYASHAGELLMCGKDGMLYLVASNTVVSCAKVGPGLGCAASLHCHDCDLDFAAVASDGSMVLGRFEQDAPAAPGQRRRLGTRPQVVERFLLDDLDRTSKKLPAGMKPRWTSFVVDELGRGLLASEGNCLLLLDLGLRPGSVRSILRVLQFGHRGECWGLAFHPKMDGLCATSDDKGVIHFWDTTERCPLAQKVYRADLPTWSLDFSPEGDLLALGQDNGIITVLHFPSLEVIFRKRVSHVQGAKQVGERLCDVRFSKPTDKEGTLFLACACWDQQVYLLRVVMRNRQGKYRGTTVREPEVVYHCALKGNTSSPTHVMFTADAQFLMSNSKDMQILVWKTSSGERQASGAHIRDMKWPQWTAILGWPVAGVWKLSYCQTDLNAVCQSCPGGVGGDGLIAAADDDQMVCLYRFPSPYTDAESRDYSGHASHVTNIQFSASNVLVSLGGADHTLIQWRVEEVS
ncbi:unnamed protein product [Polarella glacialis]|uniref:EML-like second beta-propeller domain-containing protein n=1 Tax=Polarella glacialis TaxID=89957 RepID=A0A813JS65_POLGL|nr:unnamed protein product [Polarella glacialis]